MSANDADATRLLQNISRPVHHPAHHWRAHSSAANRSYLPRAPHARAWRAVILAVRKEDEAVPAAIVRKSLRVGRRVACRMHVRRQMGRNVVVNQTRREKFFEDCFVNPIDAGDLRRYLSPKKDGYLAKDAQGFAEGDMLQVKVTAFHDAEADVWVAESEDVPGLITEADTLEALIRKLRALIPELLAANGKDARQDVPFTVEVKDVAHAMEA
ncbi:DUF1902 domain-containing protein [Paraburkholderia sp. EG304]|uniref:DUF1902 domain-containing protein n=1 Tax=Paraburkholderia sp. EG304 TaxID=3237015 RepID=UPI00397BA2D1